MDFSCEKSLINWQRLRMFVALMRDFNRLSVDFGPVDLSALALFAALCFGLVMVLSPIDQGFEGLLQLHKLFYEGPAT
jgi:hypothetical protein